MRTIRDAALAFIVWIVAAWHELRAAIHEARHPKKPTAPKFDPEHIPVILPPRMGPLVETLVSPHPLPLTQVPIRSTKADAKRAALAYAEKRAGRKLPWKTARKLLSQWEREERLTVANLEAMESEYADRMRELDGVPA